MDTQADSTYKLAAMKKNSTKMEAYLHGANVRKLLRRKAALTLFFGFYAVGLCLPAGAQESRFSTFRAPGAGTSAAQGTYPVGGSNSAGETIGFYLSADWGRYGFLRHPDGHIVTLTFAGSCGESVSPNSINASGVIAGTYLDPTNCESFHGFVRDPSGAYTTFDAPGAGTGNNQGTCWSGCSINDSGTIAGMWVDPSGLGHGLVRDPYSGAITTFDPTGSVFTVVCWPEGIGPTGLISGTYTDANGVYHGYLRTPEGRITTFDAPGAGTLSGQGTSPSGMNQWGAIAGNYTDAGGANHGFLRDLSGHTTTFDAPNAGTGANQGTVPYSINASGEIAGCYSDANSEPHGFVGVPGSFAIINAPGAGEFACAYTVSGSGVVTGYFANANGVAVGFLLAP